MFYRFRFFRQAKAIHLPSAEKEAVRRELETFMKTHAVRAGAPARLLKQRSNLFKPALAFAAVLLLIGAGTASAAEGALPDNVPLYFIKTAINEPIRRTLAITPQAKADVETKISERRLEETGALASKGRLTVHLQQQAEDRLVKQVEKTQERIEALKEKEKPQAVDRLRAKLEKTLEVHEKIFDDLDHEQSSTRTTIAPTVKRLREKGEALKRDREQKKVEREKVDEDKKSSESERERDQKSGRSRDE